MRLARGVVLSPQFASQNNTPMYANATKISAAVMFQFNFYYDDAYHTRTYSVVEPRILIIAFNLL